MHFNHEAVERTQCVVQTPGVVRESTRIDDDSLRCSTRRMNYLDKRCGVVCLHMLKGDSLTLGGFSGKTEMVIQRHRPIHLRFALTQEVQIHTAEHDHP